MRSKTRWGLSLIVLGAALLLAALLLLLRGRALDARAAESAGSVMAQLEAQISPAWTPPSPTPSPTLSPSPSPAVSSAPAAIPSPNPSPSPTPVPELPTVRIDGHDYTGYLYFPSLERTLPVMELVYLEDLLLAPCLQKGSPHEDNAVIAAHNFPSQFGPLRQMEGGEAVYFTDMNGIEIAYTVSAVTTVQPWEQALVMESRHDLVLYTCTTGGKARVMIACDRTE